MSLTYVYDSQGSKRILGDEIGSGGEAKVYVLAQRHDLLVKLYHENILKNRIDLQEKIGAMILLKDKIKGVSVSWPLLDVFDQNKQWVGYAMSRAEGAPMAQMAHAMAYKKAFSSLDREQIVSYLLNFLTTIKKLHSINVCVGDYNLNNVICNPVNDKITIIDCDSFQFKNDKKFFPCPVGSPDMIPKEHHNKKFNEILRTKESEVFSVAIILFKCLLMGRHPYDIVGGEDPVTNLRNGLFAYGKGNTGIPIGHWYNIWSHMPYTLKSMFIAVFTEGSDNLDKRPTIVDWINELNVYQKGMKKGWHDKLIKPAQPKSQERKGENLIIN